MPRNSGGSYTLPAGNPVVTHTTITSSWANSTLADIGSELTSSLDRSGRGAMLAPLPLANGSSALPALTFSAETSSGLFRNASQDLEMSINGTVVQKWLSTGLTAPLGATLTQSQANTVALVATGNGTAAGATLTGGSSNGAGVTAIGGGTSGAGINATGGSSNGTGGVFAGGAGGGNAIVAMGVGASAAVVGTGGATSGSGGFFTGGAPNGIGAKAFGTGTGAGVSATGGTSSGPGVLATGGASNGSGVVATGGASNGNGLFAFGTGSGVGISATGGASAGNGIIGTAGSNAADGIVAVGVSGGNGLRASSSATNVVVAKMDGYVEMSGGTRPASSTGFVDTLTRGNIIKAWGRCETDGLGGITVLDGFNLNGGATACTIAGSGLQINCAFASPMANASYAVLLTGCGSLSTPTVYCSEINLVGERSTTGFSFVAQPGTGTLLNFNTSALSISFMVIGAQ